MFASSTPRAPSFDKLAPPRSVKATTCAMGSDEQREACDPRDLPSEASDPRQPEAGEEAIAADSDPGEEEPKTRRAR